MSLDARDRLSVEEELRSGRLERLFLDWSLPRGGIFAIYPPGRHQARHLLALDQSGNEARRLIAIARDRHAAGGTAPHHSLRS